MYKITLANYETGETVGIKAANEEAARQQLKEEYPETDWQQYKFLKMEAVIELTMAQAERLSEIGALCPMKLKEEDRPLEKMGLIEVYRGPDFKGRYIEEIIIPTRYYYDHRRANNIHITK